jgi:hypothetical protein
MLDNEYHMLEKFQTFPTPRNLKITVVVAGGAFVALLVVMWQYINATAAAGVPSVFELELAFSGDQTRTILLLWVLEDLAQGQLYWAMIGLALMPAYALCLWGAILLVTRPLPEGRLKRFGFEASVIPFGAWLSNAIANLDLISMLNTANTAPVRNITDVTILTASVALVVTFALLVVAILGFVVICVFFLRTRKFRRYV